MKHINVFFASSSELKRERMELVDLIQDMNEDLERRDIKFKPVLWEYMDSSMRAARKEDEYLEKLRESEVCIVLFWKTIGEYTVEELNVAVLEMKNGRFPKEVHVLFKEPAENASEELISFKNGFSYTYALDQIVFENAIILRKQVEKLLTDYIKYTYRKENE